MSGCGGATPRHHLHGELVALMATLTLGTALNCSQVTILVGCAVGTDDWIWQVQFAKLWQMLTRRCLCGQCHIINKLAGVPSFEHPLETLRLELVLSLYQLSILPEMIKQGYY